MLHFTYVQLFTLFQDQQDRNDHGCQHGGQEQQGEAIAGENAGLLTLCHAESAIITQVIPVEVGMGALAEYFLAVHTFFILLVGEGYCYSRDGQKRKMSSLRDHNPAGS